MCAILLHCSVAAVVVVAVFVVVVVVDHTICTNTVTSTHRPVQDVDDFNRSLTVGVPNR